MWKLHNPQNWKNAFVNDVERDIIRYNAANGLIPNAL